VFVPGPTVEPVAFRNFNFCPHCATRGDQALLVRLREGVPMISRSDGLNFHLLLADSPLPYPAEFSAMPTQRLSVCFWYSFGRRQRKNSTAVVILSDLHSERTGLFRKIELAADLLTSKLLRSGSLATLYQFTADCLVELPY
jgi:hypothetical protein